MSSTTKTLPYVTTANSCIKKIGKSYWKELKNRLLTKSTILLILYLFAVNTCTVIGYLSAIDLTTPLGGKSCLEPAPSVSKSTDNIFNICRNFLFILIPFAGWLGDSRIGLDNAVVISLWSGWLGTLLQTISAAIQHQLCDGYFISYVIAKYCLSTSSLILMSISVSFCYANIFSYGLNQLVVTGQSNVKARAYVNWIIWVLFLSGNPLFVVTFLNIVNPYTGTIGATMFAFASFCLCLCLHLNCSHWFEPVYTKNHYKLLFGVLRYSWKQKYPENRSSFSYWNDKELPTRIDFAKARFGGPYSHEEVESVKTFLRILVVLTSLIPFLMASDPFINGMFLYAHQFKDGANSLNGLGRYFVWFIGDDIILIAIPLLELVILPLYPKLEYFLSSPLKGIGLSMILLLSSMAMLSLFDIIGRAVTTAAEKVPCWFLWIPGDPELNLSFWVLLIPGILAGIVDMLSLLCFFEFLCSQAPAGMSGILIGLLWLVRSLCIDASAVILMVFEKLHDLFSHRIVSCISFMVFILGSIALVGFILYAITSYWYRRRERNADLRLRMAVEEHYEHQIRFAARKSMLHDADNDDDESVESVKGRPSAAMVDFIANEQQ